MKSNTIKALVALVILFGASFLSSCDNDSDNKPSISESEKKEQVNKVLTLREDLNFINRFVDENINDASSGEGRTSFTRNLITRVKDSAPCTEASEEELPDGSVKITLDFGDGCQTEEGVQVAGKVIMIFRFSDNTLAYELEFTDYAELSGENAGEIANGTVAGSFEIDLEAGKFIQEMEQDLTITYPNGTEASYKMAQASELTDDGLRVASLTTSGNLADGGVFAMTVSKALVFDFNCESDLPIEGEEILTFQGNTIKVNYGNGTCDDSYSVN